MAVNQKTITHNRIFGLDLLRSVAIILVMITHTSVLLNFNESVHGKIFNITGLLGVELFFVLSGFLIGTILVKGFHKNEDFNFGSIKGFWIRRWFRTLPNYYLMFFVYALLFYFGQHINIFSKAKYLAYLFFLQNAVTKHPNDFYIVAWSLTIEEWFYISFPLVLFIWSKAYKSNKYRTFLLTIVVFATVCLCLRVFCANYFNVGWDDGARKIMPLRLDSIAIGVFTAFVNFHYPELLKKYYKIFAVLGLVVLGILMIAFYYGFVQYYNGNTPEKDEHTNIFFKTLFFTLFSIAIALIIPFLSFLRTCSNRTILRVVTFCSTVSYSVYLVHYVFIKLFDRIFKYHGVYEFVCVWIFTFLASYFLYNYFEVKMTNLRNYFNASKHTTLVTNGTA